MDYIEFDRNNFSNVKKLFVDGKARLLIAEPGPSSYHQGEDHIFDLLVHLYDLPIFENRIPLGNHGLSFHVQRGLTKKGGEDWQTGYENDRQYTLRPIREPSGDSLWDACRELGDRLSFQGYEFKIGFQPTVGRGLAKDQGMNFCIPRDKPVRPAFERSIYSFVGRINHCLTMDRMKREQIHPKFIPQIVEYAMQDLKERNAFERNVRAGMQADCFLGFRAKTENN